MVFFKKFTILMSYTWNARQNIMVILSPRADTEGGKLPPIIAKKNYEKI